jgi:hypothetical protein
MRRTAANQVVGDWRVCIHHRLAGLRVEASRHDDAEIDLPSITLKCFNSA